MHPFDLQRPATAGDAARRLAAPGASPLGGGTDLLACMQQAVLRPSALVDLRGIPEGDAIALDPSGDLRIGALARLHDVATHSLVASHLPLLAAAAASVGTGTLRHMGTLGGSLCQRPRCRYFRGRVPCHKNGGDGCPARDGENHDLAILGGDPCWIVHPSDPAVALVALEATVELSSVAGDRALPIATFFVLPSVRLDHETVLRAGEWIRAVVIPAASLGGVQRWYKTVEPGAPAFALASLAATRRLDGEVRLVLGGVAPVPWRIYGSIEEDASVGNLDEADVETLADRALYDAAPLSRNGGKVSMATGLLQQAIRDLWRDPVTGEAA